MPHTLLSVHASNRIGTSACSKRTEVCNISLQTDQTQTVQIICQTGINQLSPATYHGLWYIPSSANKHQSTMRSLGVLTSGSIFLRHSHSFFILWRYLVVFPKYVNRTQCDWDWALCTLRQAIPDHCAFQCHLLGMSFHIESTMPAAKTADKKANVSARHAVSVHMLSVKIQTAIVSRRLRVIEA